MRRLFLLLATISVAACTGKESRYGEPIFGKVKDGNPVAVTKTGEVKGENREGVAIFRGIPYGASVDGENRFKPAAPAPAWEGVRDCTSNGPIAVQIGGSISIPPLHPPSQVRKQDRTP